MLPSKRPRKLIGNRQPFAIGVRRGRNRRYIAVTLVQPRIAGFRAEMLADTPLNRCASPHRVSTRTRQKKQWSDGPIDGIVRADLSTPVRADLLAHRCV